MKSSSNETGADLREMRELLGWSLGQTCERAAGVVDVARLSRYERAIPGWGMRPDQVAAVRKVLAMAMMERAARFQELVSVLPEAAHLSA